MRERMKRWLALMLAVALMLNSDIAALADMSSAEQTEGQTAFTETEAEMESESETETESESETESETETESESDSEAAPETEMVTEAESETESLQTETEEETAGTDTLSENTRIHRALSSAAFLADTEAAAEPGAGEAGHVHVGERLYAVDLFSDENRVEYVVAHFFTKKPVLGTSEQDGQSIFQIGADGGEEYRQYMTKTNNSYGVKIPEFEDASGNTGADRERYAWVSFEIYVKNEAEETVRLSHDRAYQFVEEKGGVLPAEDTYEKNYVTFQFEKGQKNTVYAGQGTHSYIGGHPSITEKSLSGEILYINFDDSGIFTPEPFDDKDYEYYLLSWGTEENQQAEVRNRAKNGDTWYYIFQPEDNVTENTVFTLKDKNGNEARNLRFTYSLTTGENMLMVGKMLNNAGAWGVYETDLQGAETRTITINNFISTLESGKSPGDGKMRMRWQVNGSWQGSVYAQNDVSDFPYVYGWTNVPANATHIRIYGWYNGKEYGTDPIPISETMGYDYACFFARRAIEKDKNGAPKYVLKGEWKSVYSVINGGDAAQEIEEGTFERGTDTYYAEADFYDYYSDAEQQGIKISEEPFNDEMEPYKRQAGLLNKSLSKYYEENGWEAAKALYFGGSKDFMDTTLYGDPVTVGEVTNWWNRAWEGKVLSTGLADATLSSDGALTQNGTEVPYFNKDFIRGKNSYKIVLGQTYNNVSFPFEKNSEGYWEFNSSKQENAVVLREDPDTGYYLEKRDPAQVVENPNGTASNETGFFPFDKYVEGYTNTGKNNSEYRRNQMFGVHMEIPFSLTSDGRIKVKKSDGTVQEEAIVFNFNGDDDVWIYLDGNLVLDLGGIHGTNGGSINFETGAVTYNEEYHILNGGDTTDAGNLNNIAVSVDGEKISLLEVLRDGKDHTLTMYYMERGLNQSNMHISFNFPLQSKLTVSNQIDTSAANQEIFGEALEKVGGFNYYLYNQATSGTSLPVQDSAGFIDAGTEKVVTEGDEEEGLELLAGSAQIKAEYQKDYGENHEEVIFYENSSTTTPGFGSWGKNKTAVDERAITIKGLETKIGTLEDSAYLLVRLWSNKASTLGGNLYVEIGYTDGSSEGKTANQLRYRTYNNSIYENSWNDLRLNLSSFRKDAQVSYIKFAFRQPVTLAIDSMKLYGEMNENDALGFSVDQDQISDYGSIKENGESSLAPARLAFYQVYNEADSASSGQGTLGYVDQEGLFTLADGQSAVFTDKFRIGSYLYLNEAIIDGNEAGNNRVFNSSYTMKEKKGSSYEEIPVSALTPGRDDTVTIVNDVETRDLTGVEDRIVEDGRTVLAEDGSKIEAKAGEGKDALPAINNGNSREKYTFVYRSYEKPDLIEGAGIDLKVEFENTLRVGSITIHKELQYSEETSGMSWEEFKTAILGTAVNYKITFTNIANRNLESYIQKEVVKEDFSVELTQVDETNKTISGSAVLEGIPAGTEYKIEEIQKDGIELQKITAGDCDAAEPKDRHENVNVEKNTDGEIYAEGKAYASDQGFTFYNVFKKSTSIKVKKIWEDVETSQASKEVLVFLQRRTEQTNWEDCKDTEGKRVEKMTQNLEAVFEELPTVDDAGNRYEYRVQEELDEGEKSKFLVTYGILPDGTMTITNTPSGKVYYVQKQKKTELPDLLPENVSKDTWEITFLNPKTMESVDSSLFEVTDTRGIFYTAPDTGRVSYDMSLVPKDPEQAEQAMTVRITIYAYDVQKDIYVLDYGLPAKLADKTKPGQAKYREAGEDVLEDGVFANDVYRAVAEDKVSHQVVGIATGNTAEDSFGIGIKSKENGNGTLEMTQTDGSGVENTDILFTPTKFMDQKDSYYYKTIIREPEATVTELPEENITAANGVVMTEEIRVMPASVVYYEDNFQANKSGEETGGIQYSGNVDLEKQSVNDKYQSIDQDEPYGYDDVYLDPENTEPGSTDSLGGNTVLTGDSDNYKNVGKATFTFTGTGFDIVGRTDNRSVLVTYFVTDSNGKVRRFGSVDTFYEGEEKDGLFQLPVISVHEDKRDTYTVELWVQSRTYTENGENGETTEGRFLMDGIRIYNPLSVEDTEDYAKEEQGAETFKIRELILGKTELSDQGTIVGNFDWNKAEAKAALVYSDLASAANIYELGATSTEVPGEVPGVSSPASLTASMNDYLMSGPKNELYLPQGSAVAFLVKEEKEAGENKTLQIEAKAVATQQAENKEYPVLLQVGTDAEMTETKGKIPIKSSTGMYYKLDLTNCPDMGNGQKLVVLANSEQGGDISLTNLKVKGYEISYPDTDVAGNSLIQELDSTTVGDEKTKELQSLYETYLTENNIQKTDVISVENVEFSTPFVRKGGYSYLNVTLKAKGSAIPVILQYNKSGENGELKLLEQSHINYSTLEPIRDYTDEDEKEENYYYVFKIKVEFGEEYTENQQYFFMVGALMAGKSKHTANITGAPVSIWVKGTGWTPDVKVKNADTPTNQEVSVELKVPEAIKTPEGWEKKDSRTYTRSYSENGNYSVVVENLAGYQNRADFSIENIDKTAPEGKVTLSLTKNGEVLAKLETNEEIRTPDGWEKTDGKTFKRVETENGRKSVVITDLAGNQSTVDYEVSGIQKPAETEKEETGKEETETKEDQTEEKKETLQSSKDISLTLDRTKATLYTRGKKTLTLKVMKEGIRQNVVWTSSNPEVASVRDGKITAKKAGKAVISVSAGDYKVSCSITVKKPKLKGVPRKLTLKEGRKKRLKVVSVPAGKVKYRSSNKKVAAVTKKGVIKAVGKGSCKIHILCNGVKKTVKIKVK